MISLTCTSCKKVLEIDDAFAGGVCRCQYCGTIQTVPASLKQSSRAGSPAIGTGAKTLYQRPSRGNINAPGDAASEATSPSGARGTSSAAGEMPPTRAPMPGAGRKSLIPPIAMRSALAAVVVVVVILAVLAWFILW